MNATMSKIQFWQEAIDQTERELSRVTQSDSSQREFLLRQLERYRGHRDRPVIKEDSTT